MNDHQLGMNDGEYLWGFDRKYVMNERWMRDTVGDADRDTDGDRDRGTDRDTDWDAYIEKRKDNDEQASERANLDHHLERQDRSSSCHDIARAMRPGVMDQKSEVEMS